MSGINGKMLQVYRANIGRHDNSKNQREAVELSALRKAFERGNAGMSNTHTAPLTSRQVMAGALAIGVIGLAMQGVSAAPVGRSEVSADKYGRYNRPEHGNSLLCLHTQRGYKWNYRAVKWYDTCSTKNICDFDVEAQYKIRPGVTQVEHIKAKGTVNCPREFNNPSKALKHLAAAKPEYGNEPKFKVQDWNGKNVVATSLMNANALAQFFKSDDKSAHFDEKDFEQYFIAVSAKDTEQTVRIINSKFDRSRNKFICTLEDFDKSAVGDVVHIVSKKFFDPINNSV